MLNNVYIQLFFVARNILNPPGHTRHIAYAPESKGNIIQIFFHFVYSFALSMEGSSQANYAQLAKRRRDILNAILNRDVNALRHASTGQRSRDKRKLNCNECVLPSSLSLEQKVAGVVHGLLKENEKCRTNVGKLRKKNEELLVMSRTSEEKCIRLENRVAALEKKNAKLKYFYEEKIGLGGAETQIVLMKQKSEKLQGIIDSERTINRGLLSGMMEEKSKRSCLEAELKKVNEKNYNKRSNML